MVWLVLALPASAVAAGLLTLGVAIASSGNDRIPDSVRRVAQVQTSDLRADLAARAFALEGELVRDAATGAITVTLAAAGAAAGEARLPSRLALQLVHPSDGGADHDLVLVRSGPRWIGRLPADLPAAHAWSLQVAPLDAQWRLRGRLRAGASGATLRPDFEQR